jgi:hypothetical protein
MQSLTTMASLFDGILAPFQGLLKLFTGPMSTIIILLVAVFVFAGLYLWMQIKPVAKILYFSPVEHVGVEFTVNRQTPSFLYTKKHAGNQYRFIRYKDAYQFQLGMRAVTRWLATKGTAYATQIQGGELGKYTLLKVMQYVWGEDVVENLEDDIKQKLIESQVMITVAVDETKTPAGFTDRTEINIKKESDAEMASIFGENIRRELSREDWIRSGALVGCGVALALVAQAMGLIGSFT